MSIEHYNLFKVKYESTKPIRGRTEDVRPIGDRRRDWECVVQDGDKYGARLYETNCVMFCPDGSVELQINTWATPSTASFISQWSPYRIECFKRYNKLWVTLNRTATHDGETYPLPDREVFKINYIGDKYVPAVIPKVMQRVVDRIKSCVVRSKVEPFRNYCKNMLKLADGWVRDELVQQFESAGEVDYWGRRRITFRGNAYNSYAFSGQVGEDTAKRLYEFMSTATEEEYPNLLVLIASATNSEDSNVVRQIDVGEGRMRDVREYKYRPQSVLTRIDYICKQANDISKVVEVPAGKVMTNVV